MLEKDILFRTDERDDFGMFYLAKSTAVDSIKSEDRLLRCDVGKVGPVAVTWTPEDTTPFGDPKIPGFATFMNYEQLVSYHSHFFVLFIARGVKQEDGSWLHDPGVQKEEGTERLHQKVAARTLGGFFKLMSEWAAVHEEPFNDVSPYAIYARKLMDTLPFTQEILDEIASFPDMDVARYLKGETGINVTSRTAEPYELSDGFKSWFVGVMEKYGINNTEWLEEL
jgi:hypothetical protein